MKFTVYLMSSLLVFSAFAEDRAAQIQRMKENINAGKAKAASVIAPEIELKEGESAAIETRQDLLGLVSSIKDKAVAVADGVKQAIKVKSEAEKELDRQIDAYHNAIIRADKDPEARPSGDEYMSLYNAIAAYLNSNPTIASLEERVDSLRDLKDEVRSGANDKSIHVQISRKIIAMKKHKEGMEKEVEDKIVAIQKEKEEKGEALLTDDEVAALRAELQGKQVDPNDPEKDITEEAADAAVCFAEECVAVAMQCTSESQLDDKAKQNIKDLEKEESDLADILRFEELHGLVGQNVKDYYQSIDAVLPENGKAGNDFLRAGVNSETTYIRNGLANSLARAVISNPEFRLSSLTNDSANFLEDVEAANSDTVLIISKKGVKTLVDAGITQISGVEDEEAEEKAGIFYTGISKDGITAIDEALSKVVTDKDVLLMKEYINLANKHRIYIAADGESINTQERINDIDRTIESINGASLQIEECRDGLQQARNQAAGIVNNSEDRVDINALRGTLDNVFEISTELGINNPLPEVKEVEVEIEADDASKAAPATGV